MRYSAGILVSMNELRCVKAICATKHSSVTSENSCMSLNRFLSYLKTAF